MESRRRRIYQKPGSRKRGETDFVTKYNTRKTAPIYIWRPCIPLWEKEFTSKIGNIKWEDFVEARKLIPMHKKIMDWNDSACEEAFTAAKKRFWDHYNGYESEVLMPDPDIHIDKNIDSNSQPQENKQGDQDPMWSISDAEDDLPRYEGNQIRGVLNPLRIEDIIPTGWDVDVPETADLLTGLIVGDRDSDNELENDNINLRVSMNISRDLPALNKFHRLR